MRLHRALEAGELHHGVGDLAAPQRHQRLVEPVNPLSFPQLGVTGVREVRGVGGETESESGRPYRRRGAPEGGGEGAQGGGLHLHLGGWVNRLNRLFKSDKA